jgi:NTP pyrophosphatase (non-canonical NTP hydrolase)
MDRPSIYDALDAERRRQHTKWDRPHPWGWGDCSSKSVSNDTKAAVLAEECGEVARAVLEQDTDGLRRELVQVAAVAVAWLEAL